MKKQRKKEIKKKIKKRIKNHQKSLKYLKKYIYNKKYDKTKKSKILKYLMESNTVKRKRKASRKYIFFKWRVDHLKNS